VESGRGFEIHLAVQHHRQLAVVLVPACAVACVSSAALAATAATAAAFPYPGPGGRCHVSIRVAPWEITAGEPVTIFGRLRCRNQAAAAGQTVHLYYRAVGGGGFGGGGFTYVQSTTTGTQGFYQFQRAAGAVETSRLWYVRSDGASSGVRKIRVAAQVTLAGPPEGTQITTGAAGKVTFTGTVNPADVGALVLLQRQNATTGNEWHKIDSGRVEPNGAFTIVHTFVVPGDANLRVVVRSAGRNAPSASNVLTYEISQAQNPELTIASSADPIIYGQSVTISGVLAGGANMPVTLLAHTVHQGGFAPVAQATTNSSGGYTFAAQSPVNNTFYEVQGGGKTSAVLYEGVRCVLTAKVSAQSVQESQTLTFTGTIAPSRSGHVVYLERRDAVGQGFHIVDVGFETDEATFSIPYQPYAVGTEVFRIYVPGAPENGGAASEPFTVQVTQAPARKLTAEAPSNSTTTGEGTSSPSEGEKEGEVRGGENGGKGSEPNPGHGGHRHE
jgi:hypothetical protein